ncbi:MAG: PQQ-dependent sugar dehydrogenase [Methanosarcinaceae archaeon]|nr:PQQ-dependent sugar dehydrogenase [Methanosarcinaceae archaeon]
MKDRKVIAFIATTIFILLAITSLWVYFVSNRMSNLPSVDLQTDERDNFSGELLLATSVAKGLDIPWSVDFLPDGSIIFTERPGRLKLITAGEGMEPETLLLINEVEHVGEGGLLGIALHPDFDSNGFVYVYYTYRKDGDLSNKVVRFTKKDKSLVEPLTIVDGIPGSSIHNGGRIKFGPDSLLYITTGDAAINSLAQDTNSLAGKILRLNDDGTIPELNPFPDSPVYSYGHRNPQGLAWDNKGRLFATEHGSSARDEVNIIEAGKNYGWPTIRGEETVIGLESPLIQSGDDTWAPSGVSYLDGSLYFGGLREQSLYEVPLDEKTITINQHLQRNFGRIRDVVVGPDSFLYILTNNRDGRGIPSAEDDQIIRINPEKL